MAPIFVLVYSNLDNTTRPRVPSCLLGLPAVSAILNLSEVGPAGRAIAGDLPPRPSAREQLEQLDENTLAGLLALLVENKKGGTSAN